MSLSAQRWELAGIVIAGGVLAGLCGMATSGIVELLSLLAPRGTGWVQAVTVPALGGLLSGIGWWWLRCPTPVAQVADCLQRGMPLPLVRTLADAALQLIAAGTGLSLGRENAPRQASAAGVAALPGVGKRSDADRRLLVAAAAGAGLGAVYNVPVAGVLFAFEVLRLERSWRALAASAGMSAIATVLAWPVVGRRPYYHLQTHDWDASAFGAALAIAAVAVPVAGLVGWAFRRGIEWAQTTAPAPSWRLPASVALVGAAVGASSLVLPTVPGNGFAVVQSGLNESGGWVALAALVAAKPLATVACLRSGAAGGTLTPALATGAALGGGVALTLAQVDIDTHAGTGTCALVFAAAVLAVVQRAPVFAVVIACELTGATLWLAPALLFGSAGAVLVARLLPESADRNARGKAAARRP